MTKLTIKQEKFALVWFETGNATEAYRQAYDISNMKPESINRKAKDLTDNVKIKARVDELMSKIAEKAGLSQEYVLNTIHQTVERCKQAEPVLDRKGNQVLVATPTGELAAAYVFDAKNVLTGARLIGEHLGMFDSDNQKQPNQTNITITFNDDMMYGMLERLAKKRERTLKGEIIENQIEDKT